MTKNEMLEFAKQAGLCWQSNGELMIAVDRLEAFAKLVAAKEREACAKVCEPQDAHDDPLTAWKIAQAIRARGEA